jgi:hypothetical protein
VSIKEEIEQIASKNGVTNLIIEQEGDELLIFRRSDEGRLLKIPSCISEFIYMNQDICIEYFDGYQLELIVNI